MRTLTRLEIDSNLELKPSKYEVGRKNQVRFDCYTVFKIEEKN